MKSIRKIFLFIPLGLCFMNMQCDEGEVIDSSNEICDETTIISQNLYENLSSANFTFGSAEIINNCLNIEIGASGCDGNTWEFKLVDSEIIAESLPEQRYLKLQLINKEACLAVFKRTASFDLRPLQIDNSVNEVILHIEGLESSLHYKY